LKKIQGISKGKWIRMRGQVRLVIPIFVIVIIFPFYFFGQNVAVDLADWRNNAPRVFLDVLLLGQDPLVYHLKLSEKFGGMDVPEEQTLNNPVDISVDREGIVFVLDSKDNDIKVFQKNGAFIKKLGRGGSGPGEFQQPWTLEIIQGQLYVVDTGNGRVQILDKDGRYLKSYKMPLNYGRGLAFDFMGNIYVNTVGFRSKKIISFHDQRGNLVGEIGELEGQAFEYYDFTSIKVQIRKGQLPDSFKNELLLAIDREGNLWAVHRALNKVRKYSAKGELLTVLKIEAGEFKKIYQTYRKQNEEVENMPATYYSLSYVSDLAIDSKGNLYVLLNEPSQMIVYVISKEGALKKKLLGVDDHITRICISDKNVLYALGYETHFIYKFLLNQE